MGLEARKKKLVHTEEEAIVELEKHGRDFSDHCILTKEMQEKVSHHEQDRQKLIAEIANYTPNKEQMALHNSKKSIKFATGGKQSGKTYFSVMEVCIHLTREYPTWWTGRTFKEKPIRVRHCATSYEAGLSDVIIPYYEKFLPEGFIKEWKRNKSGYTTGFVTYYNDYVQFMSYSQPFQTFKSAQFDLVVEDEPPPQAIHEENIARTTTTNGYIIVAATIMWDGAYLYDEFSEPGMEDKVCWVTLDTANNPIVTPDMLAELKGKYNSEELEMACIHGKPIQLSGLAFKDFSDATHVVPWIETKEPEYSHYMTADPHGRLSWYLAWYAVDSKGRKFVIDEAYKNIRDYRDIALMTAVIEKRVTPDEFEKMMSWPEGVLKEELYKRFFYANKGMNIWARIMDTSGWEEDSTTHRKKAMELADYGLVFQKANKSHSSAMTTLYNWISPVPEPELFVMNNCVEHIWQLKNCMFDEYTSIRTRSSNDPRERIRQKRTHYIDLLKYLANYNPQHMNPAPQMREEVVNRNAPGFNSYAGFARVQHG